MSGSSTQRATAINKNCSRSPPRVPRVTKEDYLLSMKKHEYEKWVIILNILPMHILQFMHHIIKLLHSILPDQESVPERKLHLESDPTERRLLSKEFIKKTLKSFHYWGCMAVRRGATPQSHTLGNNMHTETESHRPAALTSLDVSPPHQGRRRKHHFLIASQSLGI